MDDRPNRIDFAQRRDAMVDLQVARRGIRSPRVLQAMRAVPREKFVPERLREFAYEDSPLPIGDEQTISQPYIVALMIDALGLTGGESVLEIGTGSGYAAAVLAQIAGNVYTVERIGTLATRAAAAIAKLGCRNVHVRHADGSRGWVEHAPYDAIIVAAGGPELPESLKAQLRIGGVLVIPIGRDPRVQELVRVTRTAEDDFETEDIADVRFVPLIGDEGWTGKEPVAGSPKPRVRPKDRLSAAIAQACERFESIDGADIEPLLQRIGNARVVLLGEASHGTS